VTLKVTTFSHTIASASPLEVLRNQHCLACEWEGRQSPENCWNWLIPCNLRKLASCVVQTCTRVRIHSAPPRSLDAEKFDASSSKYGNMPIFRDICSRNGLERTHLLGSEEHSPGFFLGGTGAVRFRRDLGRMPITCREWRDPGLLWETTGRGIVCLSLHLEWPCTTGRRASLQARQQHP